MCYLWQLWQCTLICLSLCNVLSGAVSCCYLDSSFLLQSWLLILPMVSLHWNEVIKQKRKVDVLPMATLTVYTHLPSPLLRPVWSSLLLLSWLLVSPTKLAPHSPNGKPPLKWSHQTKMESSCVNRGNFASVHSMTFPFPFATSCLERSLSLELSYLLLVSL